jgi:hypothetical protein
MTIVTLNGHFRKIREKNFRKKYFNKFDKFFEKMKAIFEKFERKKYFDKFDKFLQKWTLLWTPTILITYRSQIHDRKNFYYTICTFLTIVFGSKRPLLRYNMKIY